MHKIVIVFCCILISSACFAQEKDRLMKDIITDLKKSSNNTDKANLLLELALAYVHKPGEEKSDLNTALLFAKQAENINNKILLDKGVEAKTYFVYSNAFRERGDTAIGHQYINKAVSLYKTLSLPTDLGNAYQEI